MKIGIFTNTDIAPCGKQFWLDQGQLQKATNGSFVSGNYQTIDFPIADRSGRMVAAGDQPQFHDVRRKQALCGNGYRIRSAGHP